MDYFEQGPTAGPSRHVHSDEVDSATPPSSPSEKGDVASSPHRHTPTAATFARLLGRDSESRDHPRNHPPPRDDDHRHRPSKSKLSNSNRKHSDPYSSHSSGNSSQHHSYPYSFGASSSSPRSKAKVKKLNSLLLLTSERLTSESTRARTAEDRLTSALTLLTKTRTEQAQTTSNVTRLATQLELYKSQLALAQEEILKAQRVVEVVERNRKDAEESAARARARARKLEEEKVVRMAIEQGRREGYRQGLERGRQLALAESGRRARYEEYDPEEKEEYEEDYDDAKSERSARTERTDGSVPDRGGSISVARHPEPLPIPPLPTPGPLRVPSRPPSEGPSTYSQKRPTSRPVPAPSKSPESIQPLDPRSARVTPVSSIGRPPVVANAPPAESPVTDVTGTQQQQQSQPIRPIPIRTIASPVSHPTIVIPPDGYIPVLGRDSMITLPPPHELSQTPKTLAKSIKDEGDGGKSTRGKDSESSKGAQAPRIRDAEATSVGPSRRNRSSSRAGTVASAAPEANRPVYKLPRPAPTVSSAASLSQFDILSPPNTAEKERFPGRGDQRDGDGAEQATLRDVYDRRREEYGRRTPQTPTPSGRGPPPYQPYAPIGEDRRSTRRTPSQEITEEWRSANAGLVEGESKGKGRASLAPSLTSDGRDPSRSLSPPRGPRRPMRIVMPQPLSLDAAADMMQSNTSDRPQLQPNVIPPPPIYQPPQEPQRKDSVPFPRQSPEEFHRQRSPLQWIKRRFNSRTPSNGTVPHINVEPPSQSPSGHSQDDELNPVLLTPEDAHRSTPLPSQGSANARIHRTETPTHTRGHTPVAIVLPDNQLPIGFVPLNMTPASAAKVLPQGNGPPPKYKIYDEGPPRPSTSASQQSSRHQPHGSPSSSSSSSRQTKVNADLSFSPAPLDRPLSLFSDDS